MRTSFSKLSLLALPLAALTACQDYEPFSEAEVAQTAVVREYTKNFEAHYGKIDPNHTWGFRELNGASVATRSNVANRNQWLDPSQSDYIGDKVEVPGWPDKWVSTDGTEHVGWPGSDSDDKDDDYHNSDGYAATAGSVPGGDVTDEEIEYVSWWFRTHQWPGNQQVHFTDFFIQEISSDVDRKPDGTKNDDVPEYNYHSDGTLFRTDTEKYLTFAIDELEVKTFQGGGESTFFPGGTYDHIYNFNFGLSNQLSGSSHTSGYADLPMEGEDWYIGETYPVRNIGFYTSSGTEDFAAHYSNDEVWRMNDKTGNNNISREHPIWIFQYLEFTGKTGRVYKGWYLAFDYEFRAEMYETNGDYKIQERQPDGYYSNWILKVSPAKAAPNPEVSTRIMCEDLGNTYDYDFNDVVFDATNNGNGDWTISIQAAGGTMPIYVGVTPGTKINGVDMEAHSLMGGPNSGTPLNVDGNTKYAPAIYHITCNSNNAKDIPIYVEKTSNVSGDVTSSNYQIGGPDQKGTNNVPQKFAVPTYVQWMKECQFIEWGYDLFPSWVNNEKAGETWYTHIADGSKIYNYVPVNYEYIPGGMPTASVTLKETNFWNGRQIFIATSEIGEANSGKTYQVKVTLSSGNFNTPPKMKKVAITETEIKSQNLEITGTMENGNNRVALFTITSDKLANDDYPYFQFDSWNIDANTKVTVSVSEVE